MSSCTGNRQITPELAVYFCKISYLMLKVVPGVPTLGTIFAIDMLYVPLFLMLPFQYKFNSLIRPLQY